LHSAYRLETFGLNFKNKYHFNDAILYIG